MDREEILGRVREYYRDRFQRRPFSRDKDTVRYAGRVFDEEELVKLVDASLDFWLTEGRFAEEFSEKIAEFLGTENVILTNSGSSSNLIALGALTSEKLGERRLKKGDEVISVAAGFPSTVSPVLQYGLVPVFVDIDLPTYNINIEMMKRAVSDRTGAIFLAHTLGNPFDIDAVMAVAREHDLWVIEDNCDALGSRYRGRYTGTFGHIATSSFYPAHHITTGEGGAVVTNDEQLAQIARSIRDWGRDCYCAGGENNTCGKRFTQQFGTLPPGYDHKYVYSELGYNLKMTDMQAAIGSAQMDKLERFCDRRRENFALYQELFARHEKYFLLPEATAGADPAWFSYILTVRDGAPFTRNELVQHLNDNRIETRNIFAGNITRQPAFINQPCRIAGDLANTDRVMNSTFFLGTYPGMTDDMIRYTADVIDAFIGER